MNRSIRNMLFGVLAFSCLAAAQDQQNGGWRRLGESNPYPSNSGSSSNSPAPPQDFQRSLPPIPSTLTIKPGTYVTVRVNQALSSDRNQAGDGFAATLVKPVIVDGIVVAERGQTIGGRVTEAKKAGRVEGVSRLGLQLIDLPIVDGNQVPITTSLVSRNGGTSEGRDAAAVGMTTATGAALGAAVGWGSGAAIGAGAGAAAGLIGVLLTRGEPTIIYPETVLTFRIEQPVAISTERAPQTFRYVEPQDYQQPAPEPRMQTRRPAPSPAWGPPPPPPYFYGGYYYGYPYYGGFFYGPRVIVGFHGRHW